MKDFKESQFYKKIKPCIEKYMPKYTNEGQIIFEHPHEISYGNCGYREKYNSSSCDLLNAINKCGIFVGLLFIKYNYDIIFKQTEKKKKKNENNGDGDDYDDGNYYYMCEKNYNNLEHDYNEFIKMKNIGIILTASHNPHDENGVKIIGVDGKYINKRYENYLIDLVNSHLRYIKKNIYCTCDDIINNIIELIIDIFKKEIHLDISDDIIYRNITILDNIIYNYNIHNKIKRNICIGFDTRNSNIHLNNIIIESLNCLNIYKCINNISYITTPCMHFLIYFLNNINENDQKLNKQIIEQEEYTIHKKDNDLSYLENFNLQNKKYVYNLYYSIDDHILINDVFTKNQTLTKQPLNISIDQEKKEKEKEKKKKNSHENQNFSYTHIEHIYAYNSDQIYYDYFIHSFEMLYSYINKLFNNNIMMDVENIYVDCSNGIASLKIDKFQQIFKILKKNICKFNCIEGEHSILNYECGAEYVYRKQQPPKNIPHFIKPNTKFCTFDGDADRILYFFFPQEIEENKKHIFNQKNENNQNKNMDCIINCDMIYNMIYNNNINCNNNNFHTPICHSEKELRCHYDNNIDTSKNKHIAILDGPKIICLFFLCIIKMLSHIKIEEPKEEISFIDINIIHTAYTNSAFINYINYIKNNILVNIHIFKYIDINITCTKTGMKYLDTLAEKASIGIFFEPNGHGTIYVNINKLHTWSLSLNIYNDPSFIVLQKYLLFFNQTVGDAFLDFIAIELSLSLLNITINEWNNFYTPFPSLYINVKCPNHILTKIKPHPEHEKYLIEPKELQNYINQIVNTVDKKHGRCFIRPSGTETLLRIYAEAETQQKMKDILDKAQKCVLHYIQHMV
ncbi:phosphoacetylglucosamine mutase, putative [Plasmodium sp. gorilla clade G2]|uniref:phosphoacetylglucosamine mutase, putative n=1 Tax=Plasmodium sp. gorilla clade G2 TaxID=880535 RepID=UPI000D221785|nr:phosphoacetylglucosamine mutase, putative [Plasmodium sp. gorilla clade G2]SOV15809.1 phosphoacetylglucosamine mutase, putative [Plasmodium sp. gorilla clade G2]